MPDVSFHGTMPFSPDTSKESRCIAWMLVGEYANPPHEDVYVVVNSHWNARLFQVPHASSGAPWKVVVNTSMPSPEDIYDICCGPPIHDPEHVIVGGRSVMVLVAGRSAA